MDTIRTLEQKLRAVKEQSIDAKYPTGLIVNLSGPQGNIYSLIGMCNHIVRELGLSSQERNEYETELNAAEVYKEKLKVMSKWFGIVFIGLED